MRLIGHLLCIVCRHMYTKMPQIVYVSGKRWQIPDEKGKIARLSGKKA